MYPTYDVSMPEFSGIYNPTQFPFVSLISFRNGQNQSYSGTKIDLA